MLHCNARLSGDAGPAWWICTLRCSTGSGRVQAIHNMVRGNTTRRSGVHGYNLEFIFSMLAVAVRARAGQSSYLVHLHALLHLRDHRLRGRPGTWLSLLSRNEGLDIHQHEHEVSSGPATGRYLPCPELAANRAGCSRTLQVFHGYTLISCISRPFMSPGATPASRPATRGLPGT